MPNFTFLLHKLLQIVSSYLSSNIKFFSSAEKNMSSHLQVPVPFDTKPTTLIL